MEPLVKELLVIESHFMELLVIEPPIVDPPVTERLVIQLFVTGLLVIKPINKKKLNFVDFEVSMLFLHNDLTGTK